MSRYKATETHPFLAIIRASFWPENSIRCADPRKYLQFLTQLTSCLSDKNLQARPGVTKTYAVFGEHERYTEMCWLRPISIGKGRLSVDSPLQDCKFTYYVGSCSLLRDVSRPTERHK